MDTLDQEEDSDGGQGHYELPGDKVATATVARGAESSLHTALEQLDLDSQVRISSA